MLLQFPFNPLLHLRCRKIGEGKLPGIIAVRAVHRALRAVRIRPSAFLVPAQRHATGLAVLVVWVAFHGCK